MARALVLGAYGLIGAACAEAMTRHGFEVVGIGRSPDRAARVRADIDWHFADLPKVTVDGWRCLLDGIDVVVNAAGALQTGSRDNLEAIHVRLPAKLCEAAAGRDIRLVQISAAGVSEEATTEFFRSKARGDKIVARSGLDWVILRPTLVIGADAYGGTALLRGLAGMPGVGVSPFSGTRVQTIALTELAEAVAACAAGEMPMRRIYDLTEADSHDFPELVARFRRWLGWPRPRVTLPVPDIVLRAAGGIADALGWLGWRSPMRSTVIRIMQDGVAGDPTGWQEAGGAPFAALPQTLAALTVTLQERRFSRLYLMMPVAVALLAFFWVASGLVALARFDAAAANLANHGVAPGGARAVVAFGAIADILLGALVLCRPLARVACLGMVLLSGVYLLGGTLVAPGLWADPLGPFVKVLPGIGLALIAHAMLEER